MFRHLTNCPNPELAVNLFVVTSLLVGSRTKIDIVIGKLPKSEYAGCVTSGILSSCEMDRRRDIRLSIIPFERFARSL